jgi:hypothetical protein
MSAAMRKLLLAAASTLALFSAGEVAEADGITAPTVSIYVPPSHFGMNLYSNTRVSWPIYISEMKHGGGAWNTVATCRPAAPTDPTDPCYHWTGLDGGLAYANSQGFATETVFGWAPSWVNGGNSPQYPPTNIQDYKDWITAYYTHFPNVDKHAEPWNEFNDPNNTTGYAGTIPFAIQMEQALCDVTARLSPKTIVTTPSTYYWDGFKYIANYFAAGGGQCVGAFNWHAYPILGSLKNNLEQWDNTTRFFRALLAQYGRAGIPILISEGGQSNSTNDRAAMGALHELFMAAFATVDMPFAWDKPVGGNTALEFWDTATDPNNMGPMGGGYATMQKWLIGSTITQEPARVALTNEVRNPNGTGFTAGVVSGGTVTGVYPTNWTSNTTDGGFGVVTQIVGACANGSTTGVAFRL